MKRSISILGAFGLGAGLMYLLDPDRGKRRRRMVQDRTTHLTKVAQRQLSRAAHDINNRVYGKWVEARSALIGTSDITDEKLVGRVRAKLGRLVSHPHAIKTTVDAGWVTMSGPIFGHEADTLLNEIAEMDGVKAIEDRLERHSPEDKVPALQNGSKPIRTTNGWLRNVRILAAIAGAGAAFFGARRSGPAGNTLENAGSDDRPEIELENEDFGDKDMRVKEIMTNEPVCCLPRTGLQEVARMMTELDCGAIPVVDNLLSRRPLGIVTDRDIVVKTLARAKNPFQIVVEEIMTFPVLNVTPDTTVDECCSRMEANRVRRMIVVDENGSCCGIVAQADIARKAPRYEVAELVRDVSQRAAAA